MGHFLGTGTHFLTAGGHLIGDGFHVGDHLGELPDHGGQCLHQLVLARALPDFNRQVSLGDFLGQIRYFVHGANALANRPVDRLEGFLNGGGIGIAGGDL